MRSSLGLMVARSRIRYPGALVRELALLTLAAAAATYLAAVFPALDYHFTAAFQHARFDAVLVTNGGGEVPAQAVREVVSGAKQVEMRMLLCEVRARDGWKPVTCWAIRDRDLSSLDATYFTPETRSRGGSRVTSLALGLGAARLVGASLGDDLQARIRTGPREQDQLEFSGNVSALWEPMDQLDALVLPVSSTDFTALREVTQETHLFVTSPRPLTAAQTVALEEVAAGAEGSVRTPPTGLLDGRRRLDQSFSRNTAYATEAVALLAYLALVWRSIGGVLTQREKTHAVMLSFGASPATVAHTTAVEQSVVSFVALVLGSLLARGVMWQFSALYIPRESVLYLGVAMMVLVAASALLSSALASRRLRRIPVARLLASSES